MVPGFRYNGEGVRESILLGITGVEGKHEEAKGGCAEGGCS